MAVVEITDNGVGISPGMQTKIFELFVQADQTLDRSQGGLGIGLSVVRRLVHMHGGEVQAMSEGPGQGSTFRISLPLIAPPSASDGGMNEVAVRSRRVLIVDENADAADSLALLLELQGHQVEAVHGGQQAIERARTFAAHVVLLDIGLPEMDGYEVARRLRAEGTAGALVALTGYGQDEDVQRSRDAEFDAHLTKPVAFADLIRILEEHGNRARPPEAATSGESGRG